MRHTYQNNTHYIRVKGNVYPSFCTSSGVRQGCPLSLVLFAIVADVLLRRLHTCLPHCMTRAFADDTCMITPCFAKDAPAIMHMFKEFASISNLQLNLEKTVLVPLWPSSTMSIRRWLRDDFPSWAAVEIAWSAKYLGMYIGPDRGTRSWARPCEKFRERVLALASLHLGMRMSTEYSAAHCCLLFGSLRNFPKNWMLWSNGVYDG